MSHLPRRTGILALICLLAWLGGSATTAAAQVATPPAGTAAGLQAAVSRQYGADPAAIAASPSADGHAEAPFTVTARVLTFDTAEHAEDAYTDAIADAEAQIDAMGVDRASQVTEGDVEDLGETAYGLTLHSAVDALTGYIRFLFVREDETVFILSAIAGSEEGAHITDRIAQAMLEREPGEDEPVFHADGTSTGGLWELLPDAGDPVLEGLVVIQDQQLAAPAG